MEVKLLVGRVSAEGSKAPGETINVGDREAYALITTNQAEPIDEAAFKALERRLKKQKLSEDKKQSKLIAIEKETELKSEVSSLLDDLEATVTTLSSVNPDYMSEFLAMFHERFTGKDGE